MFTPFGQMLTKTLTLMAPSVYGNYVLCRARHLPLFSHTSPTKLEVHTVSEKNIVPSLIQHPGRSDIKQWALGPLRGLHPPFQKFSPTRCCSQHARKLCKESQHTFNRKCNIYMRIVSGHHSITQTSVRKENGKRDGLKKNSIYALILL